MTILNRGAQGNGPIFTTNAEIASNWRNAGEVTPFYPKSAQWRIDALAARVAELEREGLSLFGKVLHEFYTMRFGPNAPAQHMPRMREQWPVLTDQFERYNSALTKGADHDTR